MQMIDYPSKPSERAKYLPAEVESGVPSMWYSSWNLRIGFRHIPQTIDHYARTAPDRVHSSIPIDPSNLAAGFEDITYAKFANAVDHCAHWLKGILPPKAEPFQTVAYEGPKDIRYAILAVALAKLERKFLLPSPYATPAAQAHLIRQSGCKTLLYGGPFRATIKRVITELPDLDFQIAELPDTKDFVSDEKAESFEWTKTWEEARHYPWLLVHTSGTTGLPKLIGYTHQMMVAWEAADLMPDAGKHDTIMQHIPGRRWYSPLPTLHVVGMYVALQLTVLRGGICVYGPSGDTTPGAILDTVRYGKCQALLSPPAHLEALVNDPLGLKTLRSLDYIYFAGAPLAKWAAEMLLGYTQLKAAIGSTEVGMYMVNCRGEEDWEYYCFRESNGFEFERVDGDWHELVVVRKPELERWQQTFRLYPDLRVFRTGDLWLEHKTKPGAWKCVGRTDDLVVLNHGKKLNAIDIEMQLHRCPGVSGVVVGGKGQSRPFVLVEWADEKVDHPTKLQQLWPAIDEVNQQCVAIVRMQRELVVFTAPEKKLPRNVKGVPVRKLSESLYAEEIGRAYAAYAAWRSHSGGA
ncbi:putative AMP-binding enzyme [Amniculicola lignicola CBS 123094]|uniref:Putative AMP-binding enzyme n=1 Tax=Amniculicola lignicola CBS 123094 TaxID=1392246 RepID=A0A6A5WD21_9PLEO|nr:putative AMP-binding enzyme [Amniculicola lignicola CBS 123094]